jgi:hypothetical protein
MVLKWILQSLIASFIGSSSTSSAAHVHVPTPDLIGNPNGEQINIYYSREYNTSDPVDRVLLQQERAQTLHLVLSNLKSL